MLKLVLILMCLMVSQDDPIKPEDLAKHYDKAVTLKMEVKSSKLLADKGMCFLNSKKNFRDKDNVVILIGAVGLKSFKLVDIEDPAKYFKGKTLLIEGVVKKYKDKPQIEVTNAEQVKVAKKEKDKDKKDEDKKNDDRQVDSES